MGKYEIELLEVGATVMATVKHAPQDSSFWLEIGRMLGAGINRTSDGLVMVDLQYLKHAILVLRKYGDVTISGALSSR